MKWFSKHEEPDSPEAEVLEATLWLEFKSQWSFKYKYERAAITLRPTQDTDRTSRPGFIDSQQSRIELSRAAQISGVEFSNRKQVDHCPAFQDWEGCHCQLVIEETESTKPLEKLNRIGAGWLFDPRELRFVIQMVESELMKLLTLAPLIDNSILPSAILHISSVVACDPDSDPEPICLAVLVVDGIEIV